MSTARTVLLSNLYPALSCYTRIAAKSIVSDPFTCPQIQSSESDSPSTLSFKRLYSTVFSLHAAPLSPTLHPSESYHCIKYAAGVLLTDSTILTARQVTGLEYGTTLDCVTQLAKELNASLSSGLKVSSVLVVDHMGVLHTPSGTGRAYLTELGCGAMENAVCYNHERGEGKLLRLREIKVKELLPSLPAFRVEDLNDA